VVEGDGKCMIGLRDGGNGVREEGVGERVDTIPMYRGGTYIG